MQDLTDKPQPELKLIIDTDFGAGNEGSLGPQTVSDRNSVKDVANPKYVEQLRVERWFCMDDGIEELGGQLPGGIMATEATGEIMDPSLQYSRQSELIAETTKNLVNDNIEVWVHGDTTSGEEGCAALKLNRDILRLGRKNADTIAPTVWALMEGLDLGRAAHRDRIRQLIMAGADMADEDSFWDVTPAQIVAIAKANGANYHEVDRTHAAACTRIDVSPNIFDNHKFRHQHKTAEGLPLGALSITLGAYKNNLLKRAEKHGYDLEWVADKAMKAAIFTVESSKKLGSPAPGHQLRLALVGTRH